ncbi:DNA-binding transcriptional regulator, LysR family [Oscillospiraceae bacterium]|nr:DNA-binding transcriptional regulator, LysR family [Oscillospiraceae bacterium]
MTILQLKYVLAIASSSSMREAASKLFVSQPALSATIHELEEELGIRIFERNNKGISLTQQGREFLVYAKQAVSQYEIIEDRYIEKDKNRKHFSVSMQHYVFAVHAFVETVKDFGTDRYVYSVHETRTDEVLTNVRDLHSEIGIIAYSGSNETILKKLFREYGLVFHPIMVRDTYAYVWEDHPLAGREEVSLEELKEYPCVSFDQSSDKDFYLSEEALGDREYEKLIRSNDRATSAEIMAKLHGYSIGTGIMTESVTLKDGVVTIKLKEQDPLTIGYIMRKDHNLSDIGTRYISELEKYKKKGL